MALSSSEAIAQRNMATGMRQRHNNKKGFSLIEAAIVLGVVGLVVGGIWYSAAKFYENYKVNKTVEGLELIMKGVQNLISDRDITALGSANITNTTVAAGIVPKDWVDINGSVKNPFGGTFVVSVTSAYPPNYINLAMYNIPDSVCVKLAVTISSMAAMAGSKGTSGTWGRPSFGNISFGEPYGVGWSETSNFPISIQSAQTACQNRGIKRVAFNAGPSRTN